MDNFQIIAVPSSSNKASLWNLEASLSLQQNLQLISCQIVQDAQDVYQLNDVMTEILFVFCRFLGMKMAILLALPFYLMLQVIWSVTR